MGSPAVVSSTELVGWELNPSPTDTQPVTYALFPLSYLVNKFSDYIDKNYKVEEDEVGGTFGTNGGEEERV
jgi:hypothetical protein